MRILLSLLAVSLFGLAGCIDQQHRLPEDDPRLPGGPIPEQKGATADTVSISRIKPPPLPSGGTSVPAALTNQPDGPAAGVKLGSPRVSDRGAPATVAGPVPKTMNYEEVQAKLAEHGVNWQELKKMSSDRWHFLCTVPDPKDPGSQMNFQDTATGRGGVAAMEAVLRQIEQAQKGPPLPRLTDAEPG
jgi:hypothetical protein